MDDEGIHVIQVKPASMAVTDDAWIVCAAECAF